MTLGEISSRPTQVFTPKKGESLLDSPISPSSVACVGHEAQLSKPAVLLGHPIVPCQEKHSHPSLGEIHDGDNVVVWPGLSVTTFKLEGGTAATSVLWSGKVTSKSKSSFILQSTKAAFEVTPGNVGKEVPLAGLCAIKLSPPPPTTQQPTRVDSSKKNTCVVLPCNSLPVAPTTVAPAASTFNFLAAPPSAPMKKSGGKKVIRARRPPSINASSAEQTATWTFPSTPFPAALPFCNDPAASVKLDLKLKGPPPPPLPPLPSKDTIPLALPVSSADSTYPFPRTEQGFTDAITDIVRRCNPSSLDRIPKFINKARLHPEGYIMGLDLLYKKTRDKYEPMGSTGGSSFGSPASPSAATTTSVLSSAAPPMTWLLVPTSNAMPTMQGLKRVQALVRGQRCRTRLWHESPLSTFTSGDRVLLCSDERTVGGGLRLITTSVATVAPSRMLAVLSLEACDDPMANIRLLGKIKVKTLTGNGSSLQAGAVPASMAAWSSLGSKMLEEKVARTWLVASGAAAAAACEDAATRVQAFLRQVRVNRKVVPLRTREVMAAWSSSRAEHLAKLKRSEEEKLAKHARRVFSSLPEHPSSPAAPGLAIPDKASFVKLATEISSTVGLGPVKAWISNFLKDAAAYCKAGKPMLLRHVLISGGLGTGRRTAASLMAKAFVAAGVMRSDALCDFEGATVGRVVFIDHVSGLKTSAVDELLRRLNGTAKATNSPAVVIMADRNVRALTTFLAGVEALQKKEPCRIALQPHTSLELAQITLQQLTSKMALGPEVDLDLVQNAIEYRWSEGERRQRSIYVAFDMVDYLTKEIVRKSSHPKATGRSTDDDDDDELFPCDEAPIDVSSMFNAQRCPLAQTLQASNLGLPAAMVTKVSSSPDLKMQADVEKAAILASRAAIDAEVATLVGMDCIKKWFEETKGKIHFVEGGGSAAVLESNCLNMVLTGNPGTGKTTVARLMFKFLHAYGVLKKNVFIEANALELKGEYIGQTAPKVQGMIRSAMGGCLFLDEAYALNGKDSFSNEAIRTLLTEVENNRSSVMVILAGYRDKMSGLMRADPGLPRRFPIAHHLSDYRAEELVVIARDRARSIYGMSFGAGVAEGLVSAFQTTYASEMPQHNGGLAVRVVEEAMGRFATRMSRLMNATAVEASDKVTGSEIRDAVTCKELSLRDFNIEDLVSDHVSDAKETKAKAESAQEAAERRVREAEAAERAEEAAQREKLQVEAMADLDAMVGFEDAKKYVRKLVLKVKFVKAGGSRRVLDTCRNLVLTGNPGVGKTTFARILHRVLYAFGVLKEDTFVERNALALKGEYIGQTSPKVSEAFAAAKGGTLFLDEAYALAGIGGSCRGPDSFARDAIATLLTEAENHRTDVMVVLAGYEGPMRQLLDADPGLRRRFPAHLALPNYSGSELARIAAEAAVRRFGVELAPGVEKQLEYLITTRYASEVAHHNASLPIRMVEDALSAMSERTMEESAAEGPGAPPPDLSVLRFEDFNK